MTDQLGLPSCFLINLSIVLIDPYKYYLKIIHVATCLLILRACFWSPTVQFTKILNYVLWDEKLDYSRVFIFFLVGSVKVLTMIV